MSLQKIYSLNYLLWFSLNRILFLFFCSPFSGREKPRNTYCVLPNAPAWALARFFGGCRAPGAASARPRGPRAVRAHLRRHRTRRRVGAPTKMPRWHAVQRQVVHSPDQRATQAARSRSLHRNSTTAELTCSTLKQIIV